MTQAISWIMWWVLLWSLHGRVVVLYIRDGAVQYFCSPGCSCHIGDALSFPSVGYPPVQGRGGVDSQSRFPGMILVCGNANRVEKHRKKCLFQLHFSPEAFRKMSACLFWPGLAPRISAMPSVTFSIRCISTVWWRNAEPSSAPWMEPSSTPSK